MPRTPNARNAKPNAPRTDEIARRAYGLFVARGGERGHELEDWLRAEAELLNEPAARRPVRRP